MVLKIGNSIRNLLITIDLEPSPNDAVKYNDGAALDSVLVFTPLLERVIILTAVSAALSVGASVRFTN